CEVTPPFSLSAQYAHVILPEAPSGATTCLILLPLRRGVNVERGTSSKQIHPNFLNGRAPTAIERESGGIVFILGSGARPAAIVDHRAINLGEKRPTLACRTTVAGAAACFRPRCPSAPGAPRAKR